MLYIGSYMFVKEGIVKGMCIVFIVPHRQCGGCLIFLWLPLLLLLLLILVLLLSTNAVQLTVPMGDDGQLMSSSSCGRPVLWHSTNAVPSSVFRQVLSVKPFPSSVFRQAFSVKRIPSSVFRQVFSVKRFQSCVFRQVFSVNCASQICSSLFRRWGFPKHR